MPDFEILRTLSIFRPDIHRQQVTIEVDNPFFTNRSDTARRRTAEVLFVVRRTGGDILLVRKNVYPDGVYRLPTGGLEAGESPRQAVIREVQEETGYRVTAPGLIGIVDYLLYAGPQEMPFRSYVFLVDVDDSQPPRPEAADEIDAYRWISPQELPATAAHLRGLPDRWAGWGRFRAVSYEFVLCGIMQAAHLPAHLMT